MFCESKQMKEKVIQCERSLINSKFEEKALNSYIQFSETYKTGFKTL